MAQDKWLGYLLGKQRYRSYTQASQVQITQFIYIEKIQFFKNIFVCYTFFLIGSIIINLLNWGKKMCTSMPQLFVNKSLTLLGSWHKQKNVKLLNRWWQNAELWFLKKYLMWINLSLFRKLHFSFSYLDLQNVKFVGVEKLCDEIFIFI